ncbi:pentatricopeptide repeat-containing protein [Tanacetum coccineum]
MTQDRIMKWSHGTDYKCPLCSTCEDSHDYLFFKCAYASIIWDGMKIKGKMHNTGSMLNVIDWIAAKPFKNNIWRVLQILLLSYVVYHIWQERNKRLFQKENRKREKELVVLLYAVVLMMLLMNMLDIMIRFLRIVSVLSLAEVRGFAVDLNKKSFYHKKFNLDQYNGIILVECLWSVMRLCTLCNEALHWAMYPLNPPMNSLIISLDLSKEAEEEVAMASKSCDDDISVTSVVDKGKGLADKGKGIMVDKRKASRKSVRSRNSGIVIGENVNHTFSEDDDSDSDIDIEQRFKGSVELEEMYKGNTDSESEHSDKSIDYLSEVARCSRPNRVYDVSESDTMIEHEEYMDKLMHQLRDKGGGLTDPFTILENDQSNEKFLIHDEQTHWKMRKLKALSSKAQVIARCGLRPEKLKDISKGKQRKGNKYPSASRDEHFKCPFRCYVMEMLNTMRRIFEKWTRYICPNIQKRLELNKDKHWFWHVIPAGGNLFQVRNGSEAFRVGEHKRTCTCKMRQLAGLTCSHFIATIFKLNKRPKDYIPTCFRKDAYYKEYHQYLTPIGGMTFWPDSSMYSTVLPPKPRKMTGMPRKQRIRAPHER